MITKINIAKEVKILMQCIPIDLYDSKEILQSQYGATAQS